MAVGRPNAIVLISGPSDRGKARSRLSRGALAQSSGSTGAAARVSARNVRSRRLLDSTNTLDNAIAAPAIIGLSRPAAASGTAAML